MKILESTKIKVTKDKNGESVPHSEITEAVLVHCDIVKSIAIQEYCMLSCQIFDPKILYF